LVTPGREDLGGADDQKVVAQDQKKGRTLAMYSIIKILVAAAIVMGSVSAGLAYQSFVPIKPGPGCFTDEGQGRWNPCSSGS
jgi:hypothetical protein